MVGGANCRALAWLSGVCKLWGSAAQFGARDDILGTVRAGVRGVEGLEAPGSGKREEGKTDNFASVIGPDQPPV